MSDPRNFCGAQALDLASENPVLGRQIFIAQQEFLIDHTGDIGQHTRPTHFRFSLGQQFANARL
jgi:hypothetical protein